MASVRSDLGRVAAIDADQAQGSFRQPHQVGGGKTQRAALVQHQARAVGMALEIAPERREVAAARLVDIEVLVLEQVDGDRLLRRAAEQIEQDEKLAMMHADLGGAAFDAKRVLALAEGGDGEGRLRAKPALDLKLAVMDITRNAGVHWREVRTAARPVNRQAMTVL
jgi:hypothetical protein